MTFILVIYRTRKRSSNSGTLLKMWTFNGTFPYRPRRNRSYPKCLLSAPQRTRFVCSRQMSLTVCASISLDSIEPIRNMWYLSHNTAYCGSSLGEHWSLCQTSRSTWHSCVLLKPFPHFLSLIFNHIYFICWRATSYTSVILEIFWLSS